MYDIQFWICSSRFLIPLPIPYSTLPCYCRSLPIWVGDRRLTGGTLNGQNMSPKCCERCCNKFVTFPKPACKDSPALRDPRGFYRGMTRWIPCTFFAGAFCPDLFQNDILNWLCRIKPDFVEMISVSFGILCQTLSQEYFSRMLSCKEPSRGHIGVV
jgi:hypothetical protein